MGSSQLYVERNFLVYKVISIELNGLSLSNFREYYLKDFETERDGRQPLGSKNQSFPSGYHG